MERVWGALADPTRWRILEMLNTGELSSGEIAAAFAQRWPTISRHLAVLEEAGLVRKTIRGRQRLYIADRDGLARAAAALGEIAPPTADSMGASRTPSLANLPVSVDAFIGRQRELSELPAMLAETRVLTITGAPGVGKTRLARELAARSAGTFADGVRWVEFGRITDAEEVVQAVATAVGAREHAGEAPEPALINRLRGKHVLLVLDNCEHVREPCATLVESIVSTCSLVTVLAASQVVLGTAGESFWNLAPLSLTGEERMGAAGESEAAQLFMARARMIRPGYTVDAGSARAVDELCRRLDGIPLAIELAAARIGVLTPGEIAERLGDRFALLSTARQTDLERHQTLRGAIEWSYALLPPSQRRLLSRITVFVGGADLEAVETVCGDDGSSVLADLSQLVAASLVTGDTSGQRARYRLLETIRAFGAEELAAAGETDALRRRHLEWFLNVAETAEAQLSGETEQFWLEQLGVNEDNIRAALAEASSSGDGLSAKRLAASLALYWRVRNRFREGRRWLEFALARGGDDSPTLRMRLRWGAGFMALMLNDLDAAIDHLDESLSLARQMGDTRGEARSLLLLGNAWLLRSSSPSAPAPEAVGLLQASAELARQLGDAWCLAHALGMLGWARMGSGETAAARGSLEEALAVARAAHDRQGLRLSLTMLGRLALGNGEAAAATEYLSEAAAISEELGDWFGVSAALISLGEMAVDRGQYDRAEALLLRAAALFKESGASAFPAVFGLGSVALARGDVDVARRRFTEASALADQITDKRAHLGLGDVALLDGNVVLARNHFEAARSGQPEHTDADAIVGLARVAQAEGDLGRAAALHHAALRLRRRLRDTPGVIESIECLACLASEGGRHDHAARLFGTVDALSSRAGLARPFPRQTEYAAGIAATRNELGRTAFRHAYAAGKTLSLAQAVDYATRGRGARRRPRAGWGSITEMERAVVAAAVEGLSNAEIAKRLFISPHTAAWHLSQVYGKLGVSSRTQLAHQVALRMTADTNNP